MPPLSDKEVTELRALGLTEQDVADLHRLQDKLQAVAVVPDQAPPALERVVPDQVAHPADASAQLREQLTAPRGRREPLPWECSDCVAEELAEARAYEERRTVCQRGNIPEPGPDVRHLETTTTADGHHICVACGTAVAP